MGRNLEGIWGAGQTCGPVDRSRAVVMSPVMEIWNVMDLWNLMEEEGEGRR